MASTRLSSVLSFIATTSVAMLIAISLPACGGDGDGDSSGDGDGDDGSVACDPAVHEVCADEVQLVWEANCTECHSPAGDQNGFDAGINDWPFELDLSEGVAVQTLVSWESVAVDLKLVERGDPEASYLMHKLDGTQDSVGGDGVQMPNAWADTAMTELEEGLPLPAGTRADIEQWILDGAPE